MRLHDLPNGLCVTANGTDHWRGSSTRKEQTGEAKVERYLPPLSLSVCCLWLQMLKGSRSFGGVSQADYGPRLELPQNAKL